jgi:hypothetical protein
MAVAATALAAPTSPPHRPARVRPDDSDERTPWYLVDEDR